MSDREHGNVRHFISEAVHYTKRSAHWLSSKISTAVLNEGRPTHNVSAEGIKAGGAFKAMGEWVAGFFPDMTEKSGKIVAQSVGGVALVGVIALISAALAQMDYRHWVDNVKKLYKDELSTRLGKSPESLTEHDVYTLEKGDASRGIAANGTFAEEVNKLRAHRTESVAVSVVSSLAAFTGVGLLAKAGFFAAILAGPLLGPLTAGLAANSLAAWGAELAVEGLAGLAIYSVAKAPLHWAAHKIFRLDYETTHEHIAKMQRDHNDGRIITPERLLEVFSSANPQLSHQEISQRVSLDRLADAINNGSYKITELAFAVHGQTSDFIEPAHKQQGIIRRCYNGVCHALHIPTQEALPPPAAAMPAPPQIMEYNNPQPRQPFVEKLGLTKASTTLGYAERIESQTQEVALANVQR